MTYPHYGPPGPYHFGPPAPAPMPYYGVAVDAGRDARFMPLLVGWLAAFFLPVLFCLLRFAFFGKDWPGVFLVAVFLSPAFFSMQVILNLIALAIPKRTHDSLAIFWGGMLVWWVGVSAFALSPGWQYRQEIREIGDKAWLTDGNGTTETLTAEEGERYVEILNFWLYEDGNLQQALTVPGIITVLGIGIIIVGLVVAARSEVRPALAPAPSWPGPVR